MDHYPSDEERDWSGVCVVCGKMVNTIIIDKTNPKRKERGKAFLEYLGLNEGDDDDMPLVDYREVTPCCKSEDFIPGTYSVKCDICGQWADRRFCTRREKPYAYVCPACS